MKSVFASLRACAILYTFQYQQPPVVMMNPQDAIILVNQLFTATQPDLLENSYFPPFMKEKIRWLYSQETAHKLEFKLVTDDAYVLGSTLMKSTYLNHIPVVDLNANELMKMVRLQEKMSYGYNRASKDTFAITLAHEAVHLELPEEFFVRRHADPAEKKRSELDEEFRAWQKIDRLIIAELLKKQQPVPMGFLDLHESLKNCGDKPPCLSFERFIRGFLPR